MRPSNVARFAAAVLVVSALAAPLGAQSSFKWWRSEQFQKDLSLTSEQAGRIDGIFQSTLPRLRQFKEDLDRQEAELSRLIEVNADEIPVARLVDKVEVTRGNLNRTRTLMLLHMRQVLTQEQRLKFKVLHEQWERDHRSDIDRGRDSEKKSSEKKDGEKQEGRRVH